MGTKMAAQDANLFMANLEENFLQSSHKKLLLYLRYIDDIFLLLAYGEEELLRFHKDFNLEDHHIDITITQSAEKVNFLDTTIGLKNNTLHITCIENLPIPKSIYTLSTPIPHTPLPS